MAIVLTEGKSRFEILMGLAQGFKRLNGKEYDERNKKRLNKLMKIAQDNGFIKMKEDKALQLVHGAFNRIAVDVKLKNKKLEVGFAEMMSLAVKEGMAAGK
jgi:hypothetical protein